MSKRRALFRLWKAAARREFLRTNRTDSKAKPVRGIFDIVVDAPVRVGLAEITWSFFSRTRDTSKKTFLANPRSRPGTWEAG